MGMPNHLYKTTDATWGFIGQGVSSVGNMFAANNIYGGNMAWLKGLQGVVDRQFEMDKERVEFESGLQADRIRHEAELDSLITDFRISDARRREDLIRQHAKSVLYAAGEGEKRLREQGRTVVGAQRASIAGSGLAGDVGSNSEAVRQTGDRIEEEAGILRYNTQLAIYGIDMQAAEVAKERLASEIYKSGIGNMADIDARLTLLAGSAETSALRGRANLEKLNINSKEFEVRQQRNAALLGSFTELADTINKGFDSLQIVKKKPDVRVPPAFQIPASPLLPESLRRGIYNN